MTMKPNPMVILTGPTAVGKTALSIALAKKINGAIISADSMQVYKYMDIGSAKNHAGGDGRRPALSCGRTGSIR